MSAGGATERRLVVDAVVFADVYRNGATASVNAHGMHQTVFKAQVPHAGNQDPVVLAAALATTALASDRKARRVRMTSRKGDCKRRINAESPPRLCRGLPYCGGVLQ